MSREPNEATPKIPLILQFWSKLYSAAPKVCLPGTKFDIAFTTLSTLIILTIRWAIFDPFYQSYLNWDPNSKRTKDCAASSTSIIHALVLCSGLWSVLCSQPYSPVAKMATAPKWWQDSSTALLQLCTGYMFYDLIVMMKDNNWSIHPDDYAYVGHHIVTVLYMAQCRVLGAGHISAMGLMFTGEITNPLQNGHYITRYAIQMESLGTVWHDINPYVEFIYGLVYAFMRSVIGPLQIIHISYSLLFTRQGRENIPIYIGFFWVIMIWGIILGSMPWTVEAFEMVKDGLKVKYDRDWDYGPRYEL